MDKLGLKDVDLQGKRVLMRVDFNVPLNEDGTISDDSRIQAALPSIRYVLEQGAGLVLMSHLGRPKGPDPRLSLQVCAKRLSELLGRKVEFEKDCLKVRNVKRGQVVLLENLRFHPEEEEPKEEFVKQLAKWGDVYVNDAFGTAHRAHASTSLVAKYFPGKAVAGFLMEKEVDALGFLLVGPPKPFYALIGGAKISTKIGLIRQLMKKVDGIFLGGGMAFTFLKSQGKEIGNSLFEADCVEMAGKIEGVELPVDFVLADGSVVEKIPVGGIAMDIGPKTVELWTKKLTGAATVFWNGPMGVFEKPKFANGTKGIAKALAESKAKVVVGGGDSVAAILQMGLGGKFYHLSTGGGASLEFLEFGHLPGIDALSSPP